MVNEFKVKIEEVREGRLKGQLIAEAVYEDGRIVFDIVSDLMTLKPGDQLTIEVRESQPESLEDYSFCGHGFLVDPESKTGKTILSIWGLIFMFDPPIGLAENKKYYVCISSRK